jgi:hypothetical protein
MTKRNKWTKEEITIMKENYSKGVKHVEKLITEHTKLSIKKKAKQLNLNVDKDNLYYDVEKIRNTVKESFSFAEVLRKLNKIRSGDSYKIIKRFIERNNIDISHFDPYKYNRIINKGKPLIYHLQKGTIINSSHLKDKLYKHNLKQRICEKCGQTEDWNGEKMSLILDHINGISNDNRLENLRILCPNCNSTLPTHCKGYKGLVEKEHKIYYCECGNTKSKKSKKCLECCSKSKRKVERPDKDLLIKELSESNYTKLGKKYGVSDNAIRKWLK